MRVVLYAEGPGDAPWAGLPRHPEAVLDDEHLGPAHHLVRRCLCDGTRRPVQSIQFRAPLRIRARIPRGSDLLHPRALRQLLTWPRVDARPDLAVVLVDEDGDSGRRARLRATIESLPVPTVVGVAVRELEAWLLGDLTAIREATGHPLEPPAAIEAMEPGQAKRLLATATDGENALQQRIEIAHTADLDRLTKLRAFEIFRKDLRSAAPTD